MEQTLLSHVGIAVTDLDKAVSRYHLLTGNEPEKSIEVAEQKVRVAIFSGGGENDGGRIELLEAVSPDSPIAKFIARKGEGLHHICLYVDDIDRKLADLKASGVRLIDEVPRIGAEGNRIAFIHPSDGNGVLIELEERPK